MEASRKEERSAPLEARQQAGLWLKSLREKRGLSQRELSILIGNDYYTMIGQLEHGRGKIAPEQFEAWAAALKIEPREFVKKLMSYYDPETHRLLFGVPERNEV